MAVAKQGLLSMDDVEKNVRTTASHATAKAPKARIAILLLKEGSCHRDL